MCLINEEMLMLVCYLLWY